MTSTKWIILFYDLYFLRFSKPGLPWYELTDYLRDKLKEDGFEIQYTKDDVIVSGNFIKRQLSIKDYLNNL